MDPGVKRTTCAELVDDARESSKTVEDSLRGRLHARARLIGLPAQPLAPPTAVPSRTRGKKGSRGMWVSVFGALTSQVLARWLPGRRLSGRRLPRPAEPCPFPASYCERTGRCPPAHPLRLCSCPSCPVPSSSPARGQTPPHRPRKGPPHPQTCAGATAGSSPERAPSERARAKGLTASTGSACPCPERGAFASASAAARFCARPERGRG